MKYMIALMCLLLSAQLQAQKQIIVNTDIEKATVFLNGAQLFHTGKVSLPAGPSEVVIRGLSGTLDQNSIQGGGKGDFIIMDIQYQLYYPEPVSVAKELTEIDKKILAINDSIIDVDFRSRALDGNKQVLEVQKAMMMNNSLLHNTTNDSLELLQNSVQYFQNKMQDILSALLEIEKKQYELNRQRAGMSTRISELQTYRNQKSYAANPNAPIPQVVMQVMADAATTGEVEVNYLTYSAGWYATYDIRASDVAKPVELTYKANIWQNSGIDWKNVELTCSTGNPLLGNNLPELTTWYLGYYQYYYGRDNVNEVTTAGAAAAVDMDDYVNDKKIKSESKPAQTPVQYTTQQQTLTNVEFNIKLKYNIPTDGKGHIVALTSNQLKAKYDYLIVPKIEQSAFLIARVTDWELMNLLPGNANLYFNNAYVGKTYINPLTMSDTLSLSMGRDQSIEVKRTMLADKTSDRVIGLNTKKTMTYSIEVRNTKAIGIDVIIKDHTPKSQSDDIKVDILELSGGELNDDTGIVTWRQTLKTKEKKAITLSFEVTYPKNEQLSLN